jgi:hypothetical protein
VTGRGRRRVADGSTPRDPKFPCVVRRARAASAPPPLKRPQPCSDSSPRGRWVRTGETLRERCTAATPPSLHLPHCSTTMLYRPLLPLPPVSAPVSRARRRHRHASSRLCLSPRRSGSGSHLPSHRCAPHRRGIPVPGDLKNRAPRAM